MRLVNQPAVDVLALEATRITARTGSRCEVSAGACFLSITSRVTSTIRRVERQRRRQRVAGGEDTDHVGAAGYRTRNARRVNSVGLHGDYTLCADAVSSVERAAAALRVTRCANFERRAQDAGVTGPSSID